MAQDKRRSIGDSGWSEAMTDTITIPRDLFERLCEMASDCEAQSRWMNGKGSRAQKYYDECLRTKNEAVAIRDRVKISQPS